MSGKSDLFKDELSAWEAIDSPAGLDSSSFSGKAQRVAPETTVLKEKVERDARSGRLGSEAVPTEHATFVRAKKKGTRDNDVNAKTFVFSGSKPVGAQG